MRHILIAFFFLLGTMSVAYGAEVELPKGYDPLRELEFATFPPSPEIVTASLVSVQERTASVSFVLRAEGGIHPNVEVRLALAKKGEGSLAFAYETKGEGGYTLGTENTPFGGEVTHTFPDTLEGEYTLYLLMRDRGGVITALSSIDTVTLREASSVTNELPSIPTTRAPLTRYALVSGVTGGTDILVMVREQEETALPRTLEVKTYGSDGSCGTPTSRGVEDRVSVVRMPLILSNECREPVTLLTLRDSTGVILDEARVPHTLTSVPKVSESLPEEPAASIPVAPESDMNPLFLYVGIFGAMVILLILGVLIRRHKKSGPQELSSRALLVIALMALFFSVGTTFAHAGSFNFRLDYNCTRGPCPEATTVWYNVYTPASVDPGATMNIDFIMGSDDYPQPTYCPYASYQVTSGPYTGDQIPDCYDASAFTMGIALLHTVTAPSTPGTHTFCVSVGLSNYRTPAVQCATYTVNNPTPPPSCDLGCEGSIRYKPCPTCELNDMTCPAGTRMVIDSGGCSTGRVGLAGVTCVPDATCSVPPPPPAPSSAPSPFSVDANTTCGTGEITTTWGSVSGATGYDIEVNGAVTSGVSSPFIQSSVGDNVTRNYRVRATNGSGQGPWTGVQQGTTAGACATPPPVPTGVQANPDPTPGSGVITVTFNPSPGATDYTIRDNGTIVYTGPATTFVHSPVVPGSNHSYTVSAENGAGPSGESAPVSATATPGAPLPGAPSGLTATPGAPGSGQITVSWNPVGGASGYTLYETVTGNTVTIPGTTYTHGGLTPGDTYTYEVRTETVSGSSVWSAPVSATAPAAGGTICNPTSIGLCTMGSNGTDGQIGGSCVPLGSGSCSYRCDGTTGVWEPNGANPNQCVGPSIDELHICTDATETNCNLDGAGMGGGSSPVSVCYNSSDAQRCEFSSPAGLSTGGAQDSCVPTTLGAIAGGAVTLTCYNLDGSNPVSPISSTINPVPPPPPPTLRSSLNIVGIGKPVTLTWNTNGPHENSCTLKGAGVSTATLVGNGGSITTGEVSVSVNGRTTFEITCWGQSGKVTVDVIPEGHES